MKIRWKVLVGFLIVILALLIVYFTQDKLPVYQEINNIKSDTPDFEKQYLIKGKQKYVSDIPEFHLKITSWFYGKKIGITEDGLKVRAIVGQDPKDYVVLTGFMFPGVIYRNEASSPLDFLSTQINEIQFGKKKTDDKKIINEVLQYLRTPSYGRAELRNKIGGEITLLSPKLNGLGYRVIVAIDNKKEVYFLDVINEKPMVAGPLFTEWVNEK